MPFQRRVLAQIIASPCSPPSPCLMVCTLPAESSHKYWDGAPNIETNGKAWLPPSTSASACNMASREIKSYALMPSIDQTLKGMSTHTHCGQPPRDTFPAACKEACRSLGCPTDVGDVPLSSQKDPQRLRVSPNGDSVKNGPCPN